jgi:hypothetical protein
MAIARGAGTEIIRSVFLEDCDSTERVIIFGEQHHIYTVLSITIFADTIQAAGNWCRVYLRGYDSLEGTSNQPIYIFKQEMSLEQTFVWNDKFSFNGHEPTDFAGPMDDATKQNAIADQGSSVAQKLYLNTEHASDGFDLTCTYIDQNNA